MTTLKVAVFVALMLVGGRRIVPWILHHVARTGSRELFTLAVLAIALGIAYGSAHLFDVSFALGAFFAGVVLAETELSHQAAENSLPLQDAFAVLFFVSVGMLFDPSVVVERPLELLGVLFVIVRRQVARGVRDRARVRLPGAHGADDFREPGADRRVLVHPRGARRGARPAAADVVSMATREGARALGQEAEIGSIEPGKRADLVLIDRAAPHLTPSLTPGPRLSMPPEEPTSAGCRGWRTARPRFRSHRMDAVEISRSARAAAVELAGRAGL